MLRIILCIVSSLAISTGDASADEQPWSWHTIDTSSRGADGVRLARFADDAGREWVEVVTGWEEGGIVRRYRQPSPADVRQRWPSVTLGQVRSPEDAVFADLDRDGHLDVVSCCEGKTRTVYFHWARKGDVYEPSTWTTAAVPATADQQSWMFCVPLSDDVGGQTDLIVGSKGGDASISRMVHTGDPRQPGNWRLQRLCDAGWIMSLRTIDMDADGDDDILFTDRRGPQRGLGWLEQPVDRAQTWTRHDIGGGDSEVMFLDVAQTPVMHIAVAARSGGILTFRQADAQSNWQEETIPMPANCGGGKGVALGDVDGDGQSDLVVSCEHSEQKHGVFWLSRRKVSALGWDFYPISGDQHGIKFDRIELLDLDADGDLDVMTCEERDNLGVIWYENPSR